MRSRSGSAVDGPVSRYLWRGPSNFVELDPHTMPAHILLVRRRVRTERDFDYYL
jgi:starch synthase (maltosyl-transferring)